MSTNFGSLLKMLSQTGLDPVLYSRKASGLVRVLLRKTETPGEHKENIAHAYSASFSGSSDYSHTDSRVALSSSPCTGTGRRLSGRHVAEGIQAVVSPPTLYTWSTTTTGFAWLNASHWTGNPGHYPGVDANSKSIADGASNDVAAFSSMAFAATIVGINFSPSSSSGVSNNSGANGLLTLGAIEYLSTTNKSISIGDNSGSAGTLTLTGVTLNGVADTVLANEGSHSLTLAPQIGGGTQDMALALGNAANNVVQVNGTGGIILTGCIKDGPCVACSLI